MKGKIKLLTSKQANEFLLPKHYSGRKANIKWAWGWFDKDELVAVCAFGKPASNTLCDGVCGKENSKYVYELNRLCRKDEWKEPLSQFVGACLRYLRGCYPGVIIVSYADSGMNHNGYIYQACNFIYTGATKERLEFHVENGHSRHGNKESKQRKIRTSKHRYVFFSTFIKRQKKEWMDALNYKIKPYPKGENKNYVLGEYQKPTIVDYK